MYRIGDKPDPRAKTLLIPAMLDIHFPLLQYAFYSPHYHPVILTEEDDIAALGLRYVHNDMCYPCILNVGQMLAALQSNRYDPAQTCLLMPTAGDACRGANYTELLRKAVWQAGFPQARVLSLNVKRIDQNNQLHITPYMVWRAMFGLFYGDILLLLTQQLRPYELEQGAVDALYHRWISVLSTDLKTGQHLTFSALRQNFRRITAAFAALPRKNIHKQRIGLVGELYIRYCHLGNWNLVQHLEASGCESYTNGLSWYVLYYLDTHFTDENPLVAGAFRALYRLLLSVQRSMLQAITDAGLFALPDFAAMKAEVQGELGTGSGIGDGWLIGTEASAYLRHGIPKVLAVQPFGCMPSHVFGRGQYAAIARRIGGQIVSVDYDTGASAINIHNRVQMLIDAP